MKTIEVTNLNQLPEAASTILSDMGDSRIFAISGTMGAGKTTLIKEFCKTLGVAQTVSSPTFALVNEYTDSKTEPVYHFDFYRIKKLSEVYDIGYEEYFYSDFYCFIEWPEMIMELLPQSYVYVEIKEKLNGIRTISYSTIT